MSTAERLRGSVHDPLTAPGCSTIRPTLQAIYQDAKRSCSDLTPDDVQDRGMELLHFIADRWRVDLGSEEQRMRRILVDHARRRQRVVRSGGIQRVTLRTEYPQAEIDLVVLLALDEALDRLAAEDERSAQVVQLR